MADCSNLFQEFNFKIKLKDSKKDSLKKSRKELRKKIRTYFKENKPDEIKPKFSGQGSFETNTNVNPIPRTIEVNGEEKVIYKYDLDDGVYFIDDETEDGRKSIQTYHNWIYEAVDGHTSQKPADKNTCVRVLFSDGHNIDLPIYFKNATIPELAHKTKGWIISDPKEFIDWFEKREKGNPQLKRLIRYLKAWCDYREFNNLSKKMPSGFIMTILATNHQYKHNRDDIALKETLINIQAELFKEFRCERPTTPKGENLLEEYTQKKYFMDELEKFIDNAKKALEEKNQKKACEFWHKIFGDRFSCSNAKDEDEGDKRSAALAAGAATSRPWAC